MPISGGVDSEERFKIHPELASLIDRPLIDSFNSENPGTRASRGANFEPSAELSTGVIPRLYGQQIR